MSTVTLQCGVWSNSTLLKLVHNTINVLQWSVMREVCDLERSVHVWVCARVLLCEHMWSSFGAQNRFMYITGHIFCTLFLWVCSASSYIWKKKKKSHQCTCVSIKGLFNFVWIDGNSGHIKMIVEITKVTLFVHEGFVKVQNQFD